MLLGNRLRLLNQKEKVFGSAPRTVWALRGLPGWAPRSQTARSPFSTTYCDKSDITSVIYPSAADEQDSGSLPCSGVSVCACVCVCVTLTAARLQSLCVSS